MNRKKINLKFIVSFLFLFTNLTLSQDLASLESSADRVRKQIVFENAKLDSLNRILDQKVEVINKEKSRQQQDKDKISKLMANSISVTNQIENAQKRITDMEENLSSIEKKLFRQYSSAIDSLSEKLNQANPKSTKEELTAQIFSFRERRLFLTQGNLKLSYNPENILSIDTKSFSTPNDKKRIEEYLDKAYTEASNQLKDVTFKLNEIDKTISLQKKAIRFLEQTENESEIKPISKFSKQTTSSSSYFNDGASKDVLVERTAVNYNQLIGQLAFLEPSLIKSKQDNTFASSKRNFQLKDYKNLLNDVKQLLTEYKYLLSNKINMLK